MSESARPYYLVQYTTGEVKELVKSCLAMKEDERDREARSLLKTRYGQGYLIAPPHMWISRRKDPLSRKKIKMH